MRFFTRFVFICNICFVMAVILNIVETAHRKNGQFDGVIKLQPLESTLVILGYGAILFNLILNGICLAYKLRKKPLPVVGWMFWCNFLLLLAQLYYFFG